MGASVILNKSTSPQILSYIPYSILFPNITPSINYLHTRLKDFDFTQIILVLSKLNLLLSEGRLAMDLSFQMDLCNHFIHPYAINRLFKKMDKFSLVFNRHQLLSLLKKSFLQCSSRPETDFQITQVRYKFGTCCLLANDFLHLFKVEEEKLNNLGIDEKKEYLRLELLPTFELYNPPELMFEIARTRLIFKTVFPHLRCSPLFIDIDKKFQDFTGLSLDDYMFLISAIMALYRNKRKDIKSDPNAIFIEENNFTRATHISSDKLNKLFELVSIPIGQYKNEILSSKDINLNYGFLTFRKYPLARIFDNKYICLDFYFLLDKISNGIFWLINDNLKENERSKFHAFWGCIFESYIKLFFEKIYTQKEHIFIPNPPYDNIEGEVADGILDYGEDLILLEYKFTVLPQEAKYINSASQLTKEIKLKFEKNQEGEWKGYGQLANSINKLFSKGSNVTCKYVSKDKIKRIFPVLIVYEHFFNTPFINYFFNKNFQKLINNSSITEYIEIKPLVVLTIEDFEKSQSFLKKMHNLILERYKFDPNFNNSFSDFLFKKQQEDSSFSPEIIRDEFRKYSEEVRKALFGSRKKIRWT